MMKRRPLTMIQVAEELPQALEPNPSRFKVEALKICMFYIRIKGTWTLRSQELSFPWECSHLSLLLFFLDRDGRLKETDQILAINGQVLDQTITHQQAISILQKAKDTVQLVVARGALPQVSSPQISRSPSAASTVSAHSNPVSRQEQNAALVLFSSDHFPMPVISSCLRALLAFSS